MQLMMKTQRFKKLLEQAETKVQSDPKENPSLYLALLNLGAKASTHYNGGEVTLGEDKDVVINVNFWKSVTTYGTISATTNQPMARKL